MSEEAPAAPKPEPAELPQLMPQDPPPGDPIEQDPAPVLVRYPTPYVTLAIMLINIAVWGIQVATGADPISPSPEWMYQHGGNAGTFTLEGEEWRLLTSLFLHYGLLHIAMNMYGLYAGGRLVEALFGRAGFTTLYLVSGLLGSVATAMRPGVVSAGASGAVFGVLGAMAAYFALHRDRMDEALTKQATGLLVFVAYNIVFGFTKEGIDMHAHLGGLAGGFACGLALEAGRGEGAPRLPRVMLVAAAGLGLVAAIAMLAPTPQTTDSAALAKFGQVESKVLERWNALVVPMQNQTITDAAAADAIEAELLVPWRAARSEYEQAASSDTKLRPAMLEYLRLRQEGWEAMVKGLRTHDQAEFKRGVDLFKDGDAVIERMKKLN